MWFAYSNNLALIRRFWNSNSLLFSLLLGAKVYIQDKFDAKKVCELVAKNQIEAITLVSLILRRMFDYNVPSFRSLQCIISGGAALPHTLVKDTLDILGEKLYNLYGTSEAGVCVAATQKDDKEVKIGTIGEFCFKWLSSRLARYQTPKDIIFLEEIPINILGEPNKKDRYH